MTKNMDQRRLRPRRNAQYQMVGIALALVLYPLSMGPFAYMETRLNPGFVSSFGTRPYDHIYRTVYGPLAPWWIGPCEGFRQPHWLPASWCRWNYAPGKYAVHQYLAWFDDLARTHWRDSRKKS